MNKTKLLFFRVTDDLDRRFNAIVQTMPGNKSEILRFALEQYIAQQEKLQKTLAQMEATDTPANAN